MQRALPFDRKTEAGRELSEAERLDWLRLIRTPQVGPATFRDLLARFGSASAAIEALPSLVSRGARGGMSIPSRTDVERELAALRKHGAGIIASPEPGYPRYLAQADAPPPLLTVWGDAAVLDRPPVAIVGARNASLAGMKFARRLASDLGGMGFAVVSGLARGIDAAAHQGSLATGTVAVLAGGLNRPYPPDNVELCREIAARGGAAVSEMPFDWEPRAQDFPRRNRIIAGLSLGLVVVEAAHRSGSLISARLAGEMGRLVFAVPGSPLDPRAAGTNALLKDGAILVTQAEDVAELLAPQIGSRPPLPKAAEEPPALAFEEAEDDEREALARLLGPTPVSTDDLVSHSGLTAGRVAAILLELDLAGRLERHPGGAVSGLPPP
ncbi:MAG TPA: DNA-processing protein DprA [Mesorhizobium sp.]|nr:DNA-processing protein DprA [Mesorhizobium sp.]